MSRRTLTFLWIITGVVALFLAFATLRLAARARSQAILGRTVYLVGRGSAIKLHQEPDPDSPVVAALVRGSAVTALDTVSREGQTWYLIQKDNMAAGWVSGERVGTEPP